MKNLSLFLFAILILGCGTEKPVVEEPEPVIEKPPPVKEHKLSHHPLIAEGTVKHGEVNVDPEPLNRHGFLFEFKDPIYRHGAEIYEKDGNYLPKWESYRGDGWQERNHMFIWPYIGSSDAGVFKYDTEYEIVIYVQNYDCDYTKIVIQFRTKPQKPVVGQPEPVIQQQPPAVPSGEHFRFGIFDITEPQIVAGDVDDGANNVDPEPLNANGIHFEFNTDIRKYKIDLRLHNGATLGWLPRGLVERENLVPHIKIMPAEGFPLLEFDTTYEIDIFVQGLQCWTNDHNIVFHTKPKP